MFDQQFANNVTKACFQAYETMGKKGKPQVGREWTKMSCFVKTDVTGTVEVLTLATGTKCIGENHRSSKGDLLNDSHAEILSRRLFLKYLYKQLLLCTEKPQQSVLKKCDDCEKYRIKDGVHIHLFCTDVPCGDASIFPKEFNEALSKRKHDGSDSDCVVSKKRCVEETLTVSSTTTNDDIHRTGAKCVPGGKQDLLLDGEAYHIAGALRIKPGRGDRTLSMSCSDKIMRWCVLGTQGGLLSNLIKEPIFLSSIVLSKGKFDHSAFLRALSLRGRTSSTKHARPVVLQSDVQFVDSKESVLMKSNKTTIGKVTPAGTAVLYCPSCGIHEVSANGRKHGIIKKDLGTPKARNSVCKSLLFEDFTSCVKALLPAEKWKELLASYHQGKHACDEYEKRRAKFFQVFHDWIKKRNEEEEKFR